MTDVDHHGAVTRPSTTTSHEIAGCLERIEQANQDLRAVIATLGPTAMAAAARCDRAAASGGQAGPLHGWPISVKDNIDVAGVRTTAGSPLFDRRVAAHDATVVSRLRDAGAVIVAKTNLSELAIGPTTQNNHYGGCRNPWDAKRIPAGSSGGSAVAVATGMSRAALGTDTGGSVRLPAASVGIVGLRPTAGSVPTYGVTPVLTRFDTVGPLARSVADVAQVFSVLHDPRGSAIVDAAPPSAMNGARIGVPAQFFLDELHDDIQEATNRALADLESLGATLVEVDLQGADEARMQFENIAGPEAALALREQYVANPELFESSIRDRIERAFSVSATTYLDGRRWQRNWQNRVCGALEECEAILSPAMASTPPTVEDASTPRALEPLTRFGYPWSLVDGPTLTLPSGFGSDGLPIGLQLTGRAGDEDRIFRIGLTYQAATDWHERRPRLLPGTPTRPTIACP